MKKQHKPHVKDTSPRGTVPVPPRNAKRWQGMGEQRAKLMEQAGMIGQMLEGEVRAWAEGAGVKIGENDQAPHWHLADNCSQLRPGKPPEPQVVDIKDLMKLARPANRAERRAKAK